MAGGMDGKFPERTVVDEGIGREEVSADLFNSLAALEIDCEVEQGGEGRRDDRLDEG